MLRAYGAWIVLYLQIQLLRLHARARIKYCTFNYSMEKHFLTSNIAAILELPPNYVFLSYAVMQDSDNVSIIQI